MSKDTRDLLSPRETEVLALAWQCMDSEPKIDFNKLADLAGYTPQSASVTFSKIKRKLKAHADGNSSGAPNTPKMPANTAPKTPKSGNKRAATIPAADGESPFKKKKSPTKKSAYCQDDDDEEFKNVRVKSEETTDLLRGAAEFYNQAFNGGPYGYDNLQGYEENPHRI
ncbi:hypothetical protein K458DRAFT_285033 [Lentithecium fluviatile CBS 122367]|uniref:Uncharacterized protein n=1 Tax=Lentithecium fluviatile CBS 122367 TaxID=1168545 RepID=A0A6G1JN66_9PLEO|nr:hypothetical protein K458DRAFT_285033 [Lentithecium fluviatile CBS 122367]